MFDIPEIHRSTRNSFRKNLIRLGYYQIQQSVYVHMFDYSRQLHELADLHNVEIDIITMEITRTDQERELKKEFGL